MKLMTVRSARAFAFRQTANVAQAFGHDAQAWAKYQCQSHAWIFNVTVDDSPCLLFNLEGFHGLKPGDFLFTIQHNDVARFIHARRVANQRGIMAGRACGHL